MRRDRLFSLLLLFSLLVIVWAMLLLMLYFFAIVIVPIFSGESSFSASAIRLTVGGFVLLVWIVAWQKLAEFWLYDVLSGKD